MAGSVGSAAALSVPPARPTWFLTLLAYASYVAGVVVATWPLVLALAPEGGARTAAGFDTFGDARASAQLAARVRALPPGTIVIGAVSDEASAQLAADAVAAFRTVGVETDMRGRFHESHAYVGVKGAAPGAALEGAGPRVVELRVGSPEFPAGFALVEFALIDPPRR